MPENVLAEILAGGARLEVESSPRAGLEMAHLFVTRRKVLAKELKRTPPYSTIEMCPPYCRTAVPGSDWAMRVDHSAGPVWWTLVPRLSTATVTGMSTTSNS
jgi:hypothetical protein